MHVASSLHLCDVFVTYDLGVDLLTDHLEIIVHLVINELKFFAAKLFLAPFLLGVLNLLPDVVSDSRPNFLVNHQVGLRSHLFWHFLIKSDLLDVLLLEEVFLKLGKALMLLLNEGSLIFEVLLPLSELNSANAVGADNITNLVEYLVIDICHDLCHRFLFPLVCFLKA